MRRTKLFNLNCILSVFDLIPIKILFFLIVSCTCKSSIAHNIFNERNISNTAIDFISVDIDKNHISTALLHQNGLAKCTKSSYLYLSSDDQSENYPKEEDPSSLIGRLPVFNCTINYNTANIDTIHLLPGSMIGRIWFDENLNGMESSDEEGVTHVLAQIYNAGTDQIVDTPDDFFVAETITDNLGYFEFFNLTPSFYFIKIDQSTLPIGYSLITPEQGSENFDSDLDETTATSPVFEVAPGKNVSSIADAGLEPTCSFIPSVNISDTICQNFPADFLVSINDEDEYNYLWEFFDDSGTTIKIGDDTVAFTHHTWITSGKKAYRLTIIDKDNCSVYFTKKVTILADSVSECLNNLKVDFQSLNANIQPDKSMLLEWSTTKEINNIYFEIQRSYDSIRFEDIGRVDGKGITEQVNRYQFVDENPLLGRTYYRLKMVGFNGTTDFSEVVTVLIISEDNSDVIVHPNPARDIINLRFREPFEEDALVEIISATGQIIDKQTIPAGTYFQEVNLGHYQTGFYFIHIKYNGFKKLTRRILKKGY